MRAFDKGGRVGGRQQHIYAHLCAIFKEYRPQQNPMLYGNKNISFFDDITYTLHPASIPVIRKAGKNLQLQAGQAHGVCDGDWFDLRAISDAESNSESSRAPVVAKITGAGALTSNLELPDEIDVSKGPGWTAVALIHLSIRRFLVRLEIPPPDRNAWEMVVKERRSLKVQFVESAKPGTLFSFYLTVVGKDRYMIRDESGQEMLALPTPAYDLDPDLVLDIVEHLAKFKMVKELANGSPSTSFEEQFSVRLIKTSGEEFKLGCHHLDCLVEVQDGDCVYVVVQNEEARQTAGQSIYCHLYSMGSRWEIENLLDADHVEIPPRFSNKSVDFVAGTNGEWKERIKMTVPQGQHQCDNIFKLFLTRQSTSFTSLELPELGRWVKSRGIGRGCRAEADIGRCYNNGVVLRARGPRGSKKDSARSSDWVALNFRIGKKVLE
ncbi:hypothetical protein F5Y12DRAFT_792579 [Xylaria sp. FL1777]|nr:hypothetical protein F5Y12DRAFT_792579 [Xylaria sp. FL1777]